MGNIYREVVCKKKAKAIILIVLFVSLIIGLSTFLSAVHSIDRFDKRIINYVLTALTVMFIAYQTFQCITKYKYSIMINKLMVHRIYSNNQTNLENIYLDDIVYIGKNRNNKFNCRSFRRKLYMCDILSEGKCCCVYRTEDGYNKFYFQPSDELIKRIENLKNSDIVLDV